MVRRLTLLIISLFPVICVAEPGDDEIGQIRLAFIEKFYLGSSDGLRNMMSQIGVPEDDIEDRLFEAVDEMARCVISAIREQALVQGLPVENALRAFGDGATGPQSDLLVMELDTEALGERAAPCTEKMFKKLLSKSSEDAL